MQTADRRICGRTAFGRCHTPCLPAAAAAAKAALKAPPPRNTTPAPRPPRATHEHPINGYLPATATRASPSLGCHSRRCPPVSAVSAVASNAAGSSPDVAVDAGSGGSSGDGNGCNSSSGSRQGSLAPLRLIELPGEGRGVVAARKLSPGELLLVCRPLAFLQGSPSAPMQQQRRRQPEADATSSNSLQRGPPKAAAGAAGGVMAPGMDSAAGATGATAMTTTTPKTTAAVAAAGCSEAALVAELQRMEWGPRQAQTFAFLDRGIEQSTQTNRPEPSSPGPVYTAGGGGGLALDLADLTDPWDNRRAVANSEPLEAAAPAPPPPPAEAVATAAAVAAAATHGSVWSAEQLAAAVRLNATGLPSDDVLLAKLYDRPNLPYIGLWPAHAMFNHSCAPNAVAVVYGSQLLIRCCVPVPPGGEVRIAYSGALGLGPLQLRRALLERSHRFRCMCARCTAEERVPQELLQLWSDIVMLVSQQLQPRLMAAAAALRGTGSGSASSSGSRSSGGGSGNESVAASGAAAAQSLPSLLDIRGQVAKCYELFETTLGQLAPSPQEALWLQASMYPLYETRARCAQLLATAAAEAAAPAQQQGGQAQQGAQPQQGGQERAELERRLSEEYLDALSACLRLQGVANSGSDMHVQLAARYDTACAAHSARHPGPAAQQLAAEARQRLEAVLSCRYGTLPEAAAAEGRSVQVDGETAPPPPPAMTALLTVLSRLQHQSPSQQQQQP